VYFNEVPFAALFAHVRNNAAGHLFPLTQCYVDAAAGQLPQVAFIDPFFIGTNNTENDEHPPTNIQSGQLNTANIIDALFRSPNWADSALFLTYDEHGGYYDHLPPPTATPPDQLAWPGAAPVTDSNFDHLGVRVPFAVVSPYAKAHHNSSALPVSTSSSTDPTVTPANPQYANPSHLYSHTSILRTIEERFAPHADGPRRGLERPGGSLRLLLGVVRHVAHHRPGHHRSGARRGVRAERGSARRGVAARSLRAGPTASSSNHGPSHIRAATSAARCPRRPDGGAVTGRDASHVWRVATPI
jgi:hypothetical protein